MKLLRMAVLLAVIPALAFAQRGGGSRGGGGGSRGGGGGARIGGGGGARIGGGGGARIGGGGGRIGGGSAFRGGGSFNGGNFRGGGRIGGFRGSTIIRGGRFGNRFFGGSSFFPGFYGGFGYGYPYSYYPYSYYPYSYDPYYYDPYVYGAPYYDNGYYGGNIAYTAPAPPAPPAPPAVINQNFGGTTAGTSGSFYRAADYYLIAFNDHTIRAALSYTVEGDQIRYTTREHEEKTAPLSSVDERFSEQINRDRRVEFRLP